MITNASLVAILPPESFGDKDPSKPAPKESPTEVRVSEIRYTGWAGFKNVVLPDRKVYALDVLLGPAKFFWERKVDNRRDKARIAEMDRDGGPEEETDSTNAADLLKAQTEMPERVRVNSVHILNILNEVAPQRFSRGSSPTVFLRPYKLFATHEAELRQYYSDLEKRLADEVKPTPVNNTEPNPLDQGVSSGPNESTTNSVETSSTRGAGGPLELLTADPKDPSTTTSRDALRDLDCLLIFMDNFLFPVMLEYRSDLVQQVCFRDLWYLYHPGDEIVCLQDLYVSKSRVMGFAGNEGNKGGEPSLWRILQLSSGRPVLCSPKSKDDQEWHGAVRAPSVKCNTFKIPGLYAGI